MEEDIMAGISASTDAGIPPPPPPPTQEKVEARKRPKGLTILSILWCVGCGYNLYVGLNTIRIDLGVWPILSNPLLPEWFRFGIPAELFISIIVTVFGIIQMFTIYGWWTGKSWSYKTAFFIIDIPLHLYFSSFIVHVRSY